MEKDEKTESQIKESSLEKFRSPLFIAAAVLGLSWLGSLSTKKRKSSVSSLKTPKGVVARSESHNGERRLG